MTNLALTEQRSHAGGRLRAVGWLLVLLIMLVCFPGQLHARIQLPRFTPYELSHLLPVVEQVIPASQVVLTTQEQPGWKVRWDHGRQLIRQVAFTQAVDEYGLLLEERPGLDEARWEYVLLLARQQQFGQAVAVLDILIEKYPDQRKFLSGLALLTMLDGQYQRSVELFSRVLQENRQEPGALAGLVNGLVALGRQQEALVLLKEYERLHGGELQTRLNLVVLASSQGEDEFALSRIKERAARPEAAPGLLLLTARLYEKLKKGGAAQPYWQRILQTEPGLVEAHQSLADSFQAQGAVDLALPHLLFLVKKDPDNHALLRRTAQTYLGLQKVKPALDYFERTLVLQPGDTVVARNIIKIHQAMGNRAATLAGLEHLLHIEPQADRETLSLAAELYEEAGLTEKAIPLYRQLLAASPDNQQLLVVLAKALDTIGRRDEALEVWRQLVRLAPAELEYRRVLAGLLVRSQDEEELYQVLEEIHTLVPGDRNILFRLAGHAYHEGNFERAMGFLEKLAPLAGADPRFYEWRGTILASRNLVEAALADLGQAVSLAPQRDDLRLRALVLAGRIGDLTTVNELGRQLEKEHSPEGAVVLWAEGLLACGDYGGARTVFRRLLASRAVGQLPLAVEERVLQARAFLGLSRAFRADGLLWRAEQVLRQGLQVSGARQQLLPELMDLALEDDRFSEAQEWLAAYRSGAHQKWLVRIMEMRILAAEGKERAALRRARLSSGRLHRQLGATTPPGPELVEEALALSRIFVGLGRMRMAENLCLALVQADPGITEARVVIESTGQGVGGRTPIPLEAAELDLAALSDYLRLYKEYGLYSQLSRTAELVLARRPDHLLAGVLLAEAREGVLDTAGAREACLAVLANHPANLTAAAALARIGFRSGRPGEAESYGRLVLQGPEERADMELMMARLAWMDDRWGRAIEMYESFVNQALEKELRQLAGDLDVELPVVALSPSFWSMITGRAEQNNDLMDLVMAPSFALQEGGDGLRRFNLAAAGSFARNRWQRKFQDELAVRQAVKRQEYVLAGKQYASLINRYPQDHSLQFDLAGIYSRQGKLDAESYIYDHLAAGNVVFPDLAEARQRNMLKQRPRLSLVSGYAKETGRQDYKDMEKNWQEVGFWYSPATRKQVDISAARINYQAVSNRESLTASRLLASYSSALTPELTVSAATGIQHFDEEARDAVLLDCTMTGKFGDRLLGRLSVVRDVVEDTTVSLARDLVRHTVEAGMAIDLLPRLEVGGTYGYDDFSDNNWTTGYDLWSSYIVFSEPTFLKVSYSYDFKESREGVISGSQTASDGFGSEDHPYWAPRNYWTNSFGIYFKHLLGKDTLERRTPRYYTAEYLFGHDSDGHAFQTVKGSFFLEMTEKLIAEAAAEVTNSPLYRKKQVVLSASYRW